MGHSQPKEGSACLISEIEAKVLMKMPDLRMRGQDDGLLMHIWAIRKQNSNVTDAPI